MSYAASQRLALGECRRLVSYAVVNMTPVPGSRVTVQGRRDLIPICRVFRQAVVTQRVVMRHHDHLIRGERLTVTPQTLDPTALNSICAQAT